MSYLNLIGLPRGVSTTTLTRPVPRSRGGRRKRGSSRAADRIALFWLDLEGFFRGTNRLGLRLAGKVLSGQEERQCPRRLGSGPVELHAGERALLDFHRGARPPGEQIPQELAQVGHVADEEGAGELA